MIYTFHNYRSYFGNLLLIFLVFFSPIGAQRSTEIKAFWNNKVKVSAHSRISPLVRWEKASAEDKDSIVAKRRKIKLETERGGEARYVLLAQTTFIPYIVPTANGHDPP